MRKIKEILRLKLEFSLSYQKIARSCNVSASTVHDVIRRANAAGLTWPLPNELQGETELENKLYPGQILNTLHREKPDMNWIHRELKRKNVTLQTLWQEYKAAHPDGYQYSYFCEQYNIWREKLNPVLRKTYPAGKFMEVDYAGQTMTITDPATGKTYPAYIFVAVLAATNYTYAEAVISLELTSWIASHLRAFEFFGGVTEILVPDNTKTGITHPCRYEPEINRSYAEMAAFYGTAIIPARPSKPRDKSKVEKGVQVVERWILAKLRNRTFFSLDELNTAIDKELAELNQRPFQKLEGSRQSLFDELEKPALKPLPEERFQFALWKTLTVNIDYHVEVEKNYYSVPYQLIKEKVDVRITSGLIEIIHKGKRVASHLRSFGLGKSCTLPAHRPVAHQKYLEWTPSRIIRWAGDAGPSTGQLAKHILEKRPFPEQGYRSCLGLIRLGDRYGKERLEAACKRALFFGTHTYNSVKSILEKGLDRTPLEKAPASKPIMHQNIRGKEYFGQECERIC